MRAEKQLTGRKECGKTVYPYYYKFIQRFPLHLEELGLWLLVFFQGSFFGTNALAVYMDIAQKFYSTQLLNCWMSKKRTSFILWMVPLPLKCLGQFPLPVSSSFQQVCPKPTPPPPPPCVSGLMSQLRKRQVVSVITSHPPPFISPRREPRPLISSQMFTFVAEHSRKSDQWAVWSIGQMEDSLEGQCRSIPTLLHRGLCAVTSWSLAIKPHVVPAPLPSLGNNN